MKTTYAAALGLSWQLAVVVIIPIVAGVKLDSKFNTSPVMTLVGFAIATAAMILVVWRQAKTFSPEDSDNTEEDA